MKLDYGQKSNGMYVLSKKDIEEIATDVLTEYMPFTLQDPLAVDIEHLSEECLFLTIKNRYITHDGNILGVTAFDDVFMDCLDKTMRPSKAYMDTGTVLLDSSLMRRNQGPRRRFTLSHEASHWILHRSYHSPTNKEYAFRQSRYIACRSTNIGQTKHNLNSDHDWEEWQADKLAAALLMPYKPFKYYAGQVLRSIGESYFVDGTGVYARICGDGITQIAEKFNVSKSAVRIRLKEMGLLKTPQRYGYGY